MLQRQAAAADVLRIAHGKKTEPAEFGEQLAREGVRFVQRRGGGRDALVAKTRERVLHRALVLVEFEVHFSCASSMP